MCSRAGSRKTQVKGLLTGICAMYYHLTKVLILFKESTVSLMKGDYKKHGICRVDVSVMVTVTDLLSDSTMV